MKDKESKLRQDWGMLPVYGHDRWSGTGRPAGRTGEPLHRVGPVPVNHFTGFKRYRWEGLSHKLVGSVNDKHTEVTERRVLDSITQPNEHTLR